MCMTEGECEEQRVWLIEGSLTDLLGGECEGLWLRDEHKWLRGRCALLTDFLTDWVTDGWRVKSGDEGERDIGAAGRRDEWNNTENI